MADLPNDADITELKIYEPEGKLIVASDGGHGFIVAEKEVLAQTRNGKQVLNVSGKAAAKLCVKLPADADHIATIGTNRKMLVFEVSEMPEMSRGKGVIIQRIKDGKLSDIKPFNMEQGLSFKYGAGETVVDDIQPWVGKRAQAGRLPPNGFPQKNKFDG